MTSIKRTLLANYFATILVMAAVTVLLMIVYSKSLAEEHRFNTVIFLEASLPGRASDVVRVYNDYRNSPTNDRFVRYRTATELLRGDIDLISAQIFPGSSRASLEGVRYTMQSLVDLTDAGVGAVQSADLEGATTAYEEASRLLAYISDAISRVVLEELEITRPLLAALAERQRYALGVGMTILIVAILASIGNAVTFSRKISWPLEELARISRDVAAGKMDVSVDAELKSGRNEISELAGTFDTMIHNLRSMVGGLRRANEAATRASEELVSKNALLERLNTVFISREERINELKRQLKTAGLSTVGEEDGEVDSPHKGV